jgi:hypothetical protein
VSSSASNVAKLPIHVLLGAEQPHRRREVVVERDLGPPPRPAPLAQRRGLDAGAPRHHAPRLLLLLLPVPGGGGVVVAVERVLQRELAPEHPDAPRPAAPAGGGDTTRRGTLTLLLALVEQQARHGGAHEHEQRAVVRRVVALALALAILPRGQRRVHLEREPEGLAADPAEPGVAGGEVDRVQPRGGAAGLVGEHVAPQLLPPVRVPEERQAHVGVLLVCFLFLFDVVGVEVEVAKVVGGGGRHRRRGNKGIGWIYVLCCCC